MSLINYQAYINNKTQFYRTRSVFRSDDEWEWSSTGETRFSLNSVIKRSRFNSLVRNLLNKDTGAKFILENLDRAYFTRSLFKDELSKLLFDEIIVLRILGQHKYFYPRHFFSDILNVTKSERFISSELPTHYMGMPLAKFEVKLGQELVTNGATINVVATNEFIRLTNRWSQYMIRRDNFSVSPSIGDIVFDCGACIGDMSVIFGGMVGEEGQIHTFDPVPLHNKYLFMQRDMNSHISNFVINECAVGAKTMHVNNGRYDNVTEISPGGLVMNSFKITSLDDYVEHINLTRVDFIKMDVEGHERAAIDGARKVISRFRPKLAISIYHLTDDLFEIPRMLHSVEPKYSFAFDHHSPFRDESVLYAF